MQVTSEPKAPPQEDHARCVSPCRIVISEMPWHRSPVPRKEYPPHRLGRNQ